MRKIVTILVVYMFINIYMVHADERTDQATIAVKDIGILLGQVTDNMDKCTIIVKFAQQLPDSCFNFVINLRESLNTIVSNTNITFTPAERDNELSLYP